MRAVAAALKLVVGTEVETALGQVLGEHVVDARILVPVGRSNPHIGDVANLGKHLLQERLARRLDVGHIQFVGPQAHKDVVGVVLLDEFGQSRRLAPAQGGTAVPDDLDQGMPVLVTVGGQARCQSLEHRVADEEDALGCGIHRGTPTCRVGILVGACPVLAADVFRGLLGKWGGLDFKSANTDAVGPER